MVELSLDFSQKRFSRFYGFKGIVVAHKNIEEPQRFEISDFLVSQT